MSESVSNSTHLTSRQQEIYDFVVSELVTGQGMGSITADEDLIRLGVVDSLGVQQLVDFCQSRYGIRVSDADYVDHKQAEASSSGWRGLRSRNR
jgi:acyl carrier protein